jgi:PAS domain S-box-containing protein
MFNNEDMFQQLFERSADAIFLFDPAREVFVDCNQAAVEMMRATSKEQLLLQHPAELSPEFQPDGKTSRAKTPELINIALAKGSHRFEWMARGMDGSVFPLEVLVTTMQNGERPLMATVCREITERKRAERQILELNALLEQRVNERTAALKTSEARFSAVFQASPIFIALSQAKDGRFVLVNDAFVKWTGYTREEILGRNALELGLWESSEERDAFWTDLHRDGSLRERECRFCDRTGRRFIMLASADLIQLNDVPHMLAMALDITERKRAEAELRAGEAQLRESEARFSTAFQASPIFIGILRTSDGRFVLANDALVNWLGCPREEALGQTCAALGMWENVADRALVWEELAAVGRIRQKECRWRNRRGDLFTVLLSADTITLGHTPHVLLLALDITQRKQAEVEILKTLAREKELSQLKSNFISMVSHEFRTPLGIIQSSAELLRDFHGRMPPAEREEQLESISRNARRMAGMMEGVLALSRLDAGKLGFHPAALDLNLFCRRVVDEVLSATNRRCLIEVTVNAIPTEAQADEQLLGHIFTNLLSNAVKYSEPGATVRFTVERDGQDAVCVIRDRGIGISPEDQQQLFKAFNRGSNVGTRPGTGLGLLLVKRCAQLHSGRVKVESKVGEGTTVMVRLPVFPK